MKMHGGELMDEEIEQHEFEKMLANFLRKGFSGAD